MSRNSSLGTHHFPLSGNKVTKNNIDLQMLRKNAAPYGAQYEVKESWKPKDLETSDNHKWQLAQALGIAAAFLFNMDGSSREHVILQTAEYLKYNYPSYWSARNLKPKAYVPEGEKDHPVWDQGQITFKDLAP